MDERAILEQLYARLNPGVHHAQKKAASLQLLGKFASLATDTGFSVGMGEIQIRVSGQANLVRFTLNAGGGIDWSEGVAGDWKPVPLVFDPSKDAGQWDGQEVDPDRVPKPGEWLPRKAALKVMAEITARVLRPGGD